jgi:hypothetical protein
MKRNVVLCYLSYDDPSLNAVAGVLRNASVPGGIHG